MSARYIDRVDAHRIGEERSLAYHRAVAARLETDESIILRARAKVVRWLLDGSVHAEYAQAWSALLDGPLDEVVREMTSTSERARALRQSTPFAGALAPKERWKIWRDVYAMYRGAP